MDDSKNDLSGFSMHDLFRQEVESHIATINDGLLELENNHDKTELIGPLTRAAHSIKGAAKIVDVDVAVDVADSIESCFIMLKDQNLPFSALNRDVLQKGLDMLSVISKIPENEIKGWAGERADDINALTDEISRLAVQPQSEGSQISESYNEVSGNHKSNDESAVIEERNISSELEGASMYDLFRHEVEAYTTELSKGLLELEENPSKTGVIDSLMRAAHSIKGVARFVQLDPGVIISHAMEDCFVAAQEGEAVLNSDNIDVLLKGVDMLKLFTDIPEENIESWQTENESNIKSLVVKLKSLTPGKPQAAMKAADSEIKKTALEEAKSEKRKDVKSNRRKNAPGDRRENCEPIENENRISFESDRREIRKAGRRQVDKTAAKAKKAVVKTEVEEILNGPDAQNIKEKAVIAPEAVRDDRFVRISVDNLNRLMGLAGESLIETGWMRPFSDSLKRLKYMQVEVSELLEKLETSVSEKGFNEYAKTSFLDTIAKVNECRDYVSGQLNNLEHFAGRTSNLSNRLYQEVLSNRMQPFADGIRGFPRMTRDLSKRIGKDVTLRIKGKSTKVDRDILTKLDAPLNHILRNAIDHGIEMPDERVKTGKRQKATISIEAQHKAGMLVITISDDGRGVDFEKLRIKILDKKMVNSEMAAKLTKRELLEFLFLPRFTTAEKVTELSGRGVGLDVVKSMVEEVDGSLQAESETGKGMKFHLTLPLTRSVTRALLVDVGGEPCAFPIARIERAVKVAKDEIMQLEDKQYFSRQGRNIGLIYAGQILERDSACSSGELSVVIISDNADSYGIVVDSFIGEHSLAVKTLDPRLGKIPNISSAAILEDGSPVLIVDVEDMVKSISKILSSEHLMKIGQSAQKQTIKAVKRILVVDDSITVREVVRKLLENKGYKVETAVDGKDGWNVVRSSDYDLVISDIDMPRMNGFEFVKLIKSDAGLKTMPVMIVSYKDSEDDKMQGLSAGANYYLTKSSFHDESLCNAVIDLIGEA